MEKLKNLTCFKESVKVYVPSTLDVDKKINNIFYVREVMKKFSEIFGGATAYQADGAWISDNKGLIVESVTIIYSYCDRLTNETVDKILDICKWIKKELKQECISLEINGKFYFV